MSHPHTLELTVPAPSRAATIFIASLIGTTIEFFDFYIYATAAVLVFPKLFFPAADPASATLQSFATFALAFFARPIGSVIFGHFGDRVGRKATLVAALLTMGISTVVIGLLPTYASIGVLAPILLALCRFGQGVGLGGEWGGAVLLATENAPPGKSARYSTFPQLGAPIGFLSASTVFLLLTRHLTEAQFLSWGWRLPFIGSALLALVGLYVRLRLTETPDFQRMTANNERVRMPILAVATHNPGALILGTLMSVVAYVIFYLVTVFALSWATTALKFQRSEILVMQMLGTVVFAAMIPVAAAIGDRYGIRRLQIAATLATVAFGFAFQPLMGSHDPIRVFLFITLGLAIVGFAFGPLGSALAELFPTAVRYTGSSMAFNLAGILGASLAPYIATSLAARHGIAYVGYYLCVAGTISLIALLLVRPNSRDVMVRRAIS